MKQKFVIFLILMSLGNSPLICQPFGSIYSASYEGETDINFGPCYLGDSLFSDFVLKSNSSTNLIMKGVSPSFAIMRSPKEIVNDEFRSFRVYQETFPIVVQPMSQTNLTIQYRADTNLTIFPLGWYNADMETGFYDIADTGIVVQEVFSLRAKKTNKYIDGFEDIITFDSVYLNPPIAIEKKWKVKSTFKDSVRLISQSFTLLSQQLTEDEFVPDFFPIEPIFRRKYDVIEWSIYYKPSDIGTDSGLVQLNYHPFPELYPDSVRAAEVRTVGTGVVQDLRLIGSNYTIKGDTIFLGNVQTNTSIPVEAKIFNNGNIPFGSISESLTSKNIDFDYNIIYNLADKKHLVPKDTANFQCNLSFGKIGHFTLEYTLESDIKTRKISFPPSDALFKKFYIVGKAVEPAIQTLSDTLDFGSLYLYLPYCESSKDTNFIIRNIGNDTLRITKVEIINQIPNFSFSTDSPETNISPNGSKSLSIRFEPTLAQNYSAELLIHNNSSIPVYSVHLQGISTTPAITSVRIDSLRAKPGSIVTIPLKVDSNVVYANEFSDTLSYNRSLLHYVGYSTENTATTQPIKDILVEESTDGKLFVHIQKNPKTRFAGNTTLINLMFKVYLGNAQSTEIGFLRPHFSNEICEFALNLPKGNIQNGYFAIDSICGLDLKAFPRKIAISSLYPVPSRGTIHISMEIFEKSLLDFQLFDNLGNIVFSHVQEYSIGNESLRFDLGGIYEGIYYLKISTEGTIEYVQKILIVE